MVDGLFSVDCGRFALSCGGFVPPCVPLVAAAHALLTAEIGVSAAEPPNHTNCVLMMFGGPGRISDKTVRDRRRGAN